MSTFRLADIVPFAISTICFEKSLESLVDFLGVCAESSSVGVSTQEFAAEEAVTIETTLHESLVSSESCETLAEPVVPVGVNQSRNDDSSVHSVNASLKLIGICQRDGFDDAGKLFAAAARTDEEWSLLKGYYRYVGFNGREVDGVFLITNRRLQLFPMEMGAKIFCVEMTKRLLGKLPVPFLDSLVGLVLLTIPRSIYVALRGAAWRQGKLDLAGLGPRERATALDFAAAAKSARA